VSIPVGFFLTSQIVKTDIVGARDTIGRRRAHGSLLRISREFSQRRDTPPILARFVR
jgi:hypothetical protein